MTAIKEDMTMTPSDTNVAAPHQLARRDLIKLTGVGAAALAANSLFNPSDAKASTWRRRPQAAGTRSSPRATR